MISLSYSRLLAMTDARSFLVRPVSLSNWSINVVAGRPLERLQSFLSQRRSWQIVSFLLLQKWPLNCSEHIWRLVERQLIIDVYVVYQDASLYVGLKPAPIVQKVDKAIHRINLYPVDNAFGFLNTYPLDSDLSSG